MRKADGVLVVLGVLVLTATLVGALSGDHWTSERTVRFTTHERPLPVQGGMGTSVASPGATFEWDAPRNSTSATLTAILAFQGQAVLGGNAIVTLRITAPDGREQPPVTVAWAIAAGATSAQTQVNATVPWLDVPGPLRDTRSGVNGVEWRHPLSVLVVVEAPSGDLPLASYSFSGSVEGMVTVYDEA